MKIIGIGDLVLDVYMNEKEILGVTGGMSFSNITYNISRLLKDYNNGYNINSEDKKIDFETIIYGACGKDISGNIIIEELKENNIATKYILEKEKKNTRKFYIYLDDKHKVIASKKKNYITKKETWYSTSLVKEKIDKELLGKDNIYIFDNISKNFRNIMKYIDSVERKNMFGFRTNSRI